jgi:hypothetical protein
MLNSETFLKVWLYNGPLEKLLILIAGSDPVPGFHSNLNNSDSQFKYKNHHVRISKPRNVTNLSVIFVPAGSRWELGLDKQEDGRGGGDEADRRRWRSHGLRRNGS